MCYCGGTHSFDGAWSEAKTLLDSNKLSQVLESGLMAWVFAYILKVKESNVTNGVFVINSGKLIKKNLCNFLK